MSHVSWETRYQSGPRLFSGEPNPTLVAETARLRAGRALDVGCGEGGDAIWLAERGWQVTAIDIAPTALRRAARENPAAAERVTWLECDITHDSLPSGPFDLVTMHYIPLLTRDADGVLPGVLSTVAPGGIFLFVTHDLDDLAVRGDFDPRDYCQPGDVAERLGPEWTVTAQRKRRGNGRADPATTHTHDAILSATRSG